MSHQGSNSNCEVRLLGFTLGDTFSSVGEGQSSFLILCLKIKMSSTEVWYISKFAFKDEMEKKIGTQPVAPACPYFSTLSPPVWRESFFQGEFDYKWGGLDTIF